MQFPALGEFLLKLSFHRWIMHLTTAVFGDSELFTKFGKSGTANDILIRNQADSNNVITYIAPNSDKIQPLLQCIAMADYHVVVVNELNAQIGEVLIALNEAGIKQGLIVTDFLEDKIRAMIKDMSVSNFDFVGKDEDVIREKIMQVKVERKQEPTIVAVDNYFSVKGVGTVILGMVKSGSVKQYDKLITYPIKKEVLVKSMQSQDRDVKEAEPGQRIGLALKGIEADELKRGYVFSGKEIRCAKELSLDVSKSRFSRYEFAQGKKLMISIGLQVVTADIKKVNGNSIDLVLDNHIAVYEEKCILATVDSMPRIIGSGRIK